MKITLMALSIFVSLAANATDICDDEANAHRAQCDITNPANNFDWVSKQNYKDNIVQVKYGASNCGGLLIAGKYILTARHCTPKWESWNFGNNVNIYQSVGVGEHLIFSGEPEIHIIDNDTRIIDAESRLFADWQPPLTRIETAANQSDSLDNATFLNINTWIAHWKNSPNDTNDLAILKLPNAVDHSFNDALVLTNNVNSDLSVSFADWENYKSMFNVYPKNYQFNFFGWGRNAFGIDPESMKYQKLTLSKTQLEQEKAEIKTYSSGRKGLYMFFNASPSFWSTCDSEALINSGDSGTPVFDQNNFVAGITSRISGADCGQVAEFTSFLGFESLFKSAIGELAYPSKIDLDVVANKKTFSHKFDLQNLSENSISINPEIDSTSISIDHNCPSALAFFEHCRVTVSGDNLDTGSTLDGVISINDIDKIPVEISFKNEELPEKETYPSVPLEIVLELDSSSNATTELFEIDLRSLSDQNRLFSSDLIFEAKKSNESDIVPEQYWQYAEKRSFVNISDDSSVGVYREITSHWFWAFDTRNHSVSEGAHEATLRTSDNEVVINLIVHYTNKDSEVVTPTPPVNPEPTPPESSGGSGGSTSLITLLLLSIASYRRFRSEYEF